MVDNLDEAVKDLTEEESSVMLTSQFKGGGGAYLDLEAAGLIVELVQRGVHCRRRNGVFILSRGVI
jgi:hypothetical protein